MKRPLIILVFLFIVLSCNAGRDGSAVTKEEDLIGSPVGVLMGTFTEHYLEGIHGVENVKAYNTHVDAIKALRSGKVKAFFDDDINLIDPLHKFSELDTIPTALSPLPVAACFNLNDTLLSGQFDAFIKRFRASGQNDEMRQRWYSNSGKSSHRDVDLPIDGNPIRVAITGTAPPLNFFLCGKPDGYEIELVRRFAGSIGRPVEFQVMDFGAIIPSILSGKSDMGVGTINVTEERQKIITQVPYSYSKIVALIRKPSA